MLRALVLSPLLVSTTLFAAEAPKLGPWLSAYTIYSGGNVSYVCSDFEGTMAAAGAARFSRMGLATQVTTTMPAIAAGGVFSLLDGSVNGKVEAGSDAWLHHYSVGSVQAGGYASCSLQGSHGGCYSHQATIVSHPSLKAELAALAADLAPRAGAPVARDPAGALQLTAAKGLNVFTIDAADLDAATAVTVTGPKGATVVVKVAGTSVSWQDDNVTLAGGIAATSVLWAFLDAKTLAMHHVNIPGTVFAPLASATFYEGRIDGNLYVGGDLVGNPLALALGEQIECTAGASGGQVNFHPFKAACDCDCDCD